MKYPMLQPNAQYTELQDTFLGLNKKLRINPREWADTTNVSPRDFPMFAPREPRGIVSTLTEPAGIMERDALVHVDGDTLYINDSAVTGLVLTVDYEERDSANLVTNSDWSQGVSVNWSGFPSPSLSSEQKYGTKNTLKLSVYTGGFAMAFLSQTVHGLSAGTTYTLSFYVYLNEELLTNDGVIAQISFYKDDALLTAEQVTASDAAVYGEWVRVVKSYTAPAGTTKASFAPMIINVDNEETYTAYYTNFQLEEGASATAWDNNTRYVQKQLISMGAYIVIMPDKMFVNTADTTDYGSIESSYAFSGDVALTPARVDGTDLDMDTVSVGTTPPVAPDNGDYWIDTTGDVHVLKQYSSTSEVWTEIPSAYTKIALTGIGSYFSAYDGVTIAGVDFAGSDPTLEAEIAALNGSHVLYVVEDDYVIITGVLSQAHTISGASVTVKREMPDMDFITESENRLWGCKYGVVDGETVNELYACALGDFKNWNQFQGISTDSYAVSLGTDGEFTGAVTYLGYPVFFKEGCLHKVYGNMPSNYRVETTECRGVQEGSSRSLAIVNELLLYKGRTDILAYDGSLPVGIGAALGTDTYRDAVAGAYKDRYYISMKDEQDDWHLFMYDTALRLWFEEDETEVYGFAQVDDELYFLDASTNELVAEFGKAGTKETSVAFSATTGIIGFESRDHKYVSRLIIRGKAASGATMTVYLSYDSSGVWESAGAVTGSGAVKSVLLPVRPRRCDHFEMKLTGTGDVRVFSIATVKESGGDGTWI